jgi:predicted MFS family arabinose efflux permease
MLPTPPPHLKLRKPPSKLRKCLRSIKNGWLRFVKVFDLGLLTDKIYINLVIGIAIAIFAEINFSLLTPFILNEFNYTTEQIATFMSTLATIDIFCRFTSPFIGDFFKQPARIMYMYALFMLIIMRTTLLFAKTYYGILYVAIGMGLAKGVRQVYMSCIVPSYIPIERLPAASGIQMVANGIILLSMGSSIGKLKYFLI